ncbi:hypothetical protein ON058_04850 [Demequina sp. B12]|uniref:hypothetical protein n=1 Tax=Demequina sp. B12 TaxID=2992757 RepID=UPI00237AC176|nr:hypothetical protein [Demequina sp. B12]MDE0572743.1 hypothetical protein [Demequina sp. B12]
MERAVEDWLIAGDPAVRWQVMRDLLNAPAEDVAVERAKVVHEGWGAALMAARDPDGGWARAAFWPEGFTPEDWQREGQPWTASFPVLMLLRDLGAVPTDPALASALDAVEAWVVWEEGGQPFFRGEVEPCINGRVLALCVWAGRDAGPIVERLLSEQLPDGGWNCEVERGATVSSFDTTINVLEGLSAYRDAAEAPALIDEAMRAGEEYLLSRSLFRRRSTGEVIDPAYLELSYPPQWHYDVLRALDYLRDADRAPDPRAAEAIEVIRSKRLPDGRWPLERVPRGRTHVDLEPVGEPSRVITLRALRVLQWWDQARA